MSELREQLAMALQSKLNWLDEANELLSWDSWGGALADAALDTVAPALVKARNDERERCAQRAEDEEEPAIGQMPPTIIERVLAGDTAYVESALIAAVRSTKKCIAAGIRVLSDETPSAGGFPDEEGLMKLMRDPRYWRDRDPEITRAVTEGFRALYDR